MISIEHSRYNNLIVIRATGTLTARDYELGVPELEHALELSEGPLRVMIKLEDFRGWEIEALWRDLKFDYKHWSSFRRIAVVGENALEKWGTILSKPFTKAEMRYFPVSEEANAEAWLLQNPASVAQGV
ncbi:STAS/SEC14 domain-containing protein [Defluviimonas sp. WL0002]|uniref:STAS/SEC14 domain-containing protein n=1 Tax=Albidovulum marisflavi TaxID=2984159 RepID=A0ABT2ZBC0_9RHOB|nr:STAS/SEC14 domain-containing protein [Defluviimonas sp. WL0002]MCV2868440.1 STAS/SEC14 domain-containing protein [Defluviimonas sp. WL0002]